MHDKLFELVIINETKIGGSMPFNSALKQFGNWISRKLMVLLHAVPVDGRQDRKLMKAYLRYLKESNILVFYQGGRSHDLNRIKNGPGWAIAQSANGIEVVPVYIEGVSKVFGGPKAMGLFGRWLPRSLFRKMVIAFGNSIDFSDISTDGNIRDRIDLINERIIESIIKLREQYSLQPQTT